MHSAPPGSAGIAAVPHTCPVAGFRGGVWSQKFGREVKGKKAKAGWGKGRGLCCKFYYSAKGGLAIACRPSV